MRITKRAKQVGIDTSKFIVIGSGVLDVLGIRSTDDVDLLVTKDVYKSFHSKPGWSEKIWPQGDPTLSAEGVDLSTDWGDDKNIYQFDEILQNSIEVGGIRFVSPEFLIKWKKNKGRDKDLQDVKLITEYLSKQS